uniref:ATP synthase F0 subunit 6 n=1 Tax=Brachylecithum sp. PakAb2 TaxID=2714092 RepID=A0A6H0YBS3_9TREM|nr:ATP synthase F0 subunit 6 [Brachylecithum sp. PakAb2]
MGNLHCLHCFVSWLDRAISGGWGSLVYRLVMFFFLLTLFGLRVPYTFNLCLFVGFVVFWIFPVFVALLFSRLSNLSTLLTSFLPSGSPMWIAPFIFYMEIVSLVIRSVVLMLRPVVNMAFGCLLCAAGHFTLEVQGQGGLIPVILIYEMCILLIHWYIVHQVLLFTHDS